MSDEPAPPAEGVIVHGTVGLPYSGKTTWALRQGLPIVSPDAIRFGLHGERFNVQAEPWVWIMAYTMLDALVEAGHHNVIVDATNIKPKRRNEWEKAHSDYSFYWWILGTTAETCRERAREAGDHDILPIIDRQAEEYDESGLGENNAIWVPEE